METKFATKFSLSLFLSLSHFSQESGHVESWSKSYLSGGGWNYKSVQISPSSLPPTGQTSRECSPLTK